MKRHFIKILLLLFFSWKIFPDVSFRVMPSYNILSDNVFDSAFGVTASGDFSFLTLRGRDSLYFSLQASYIPLKNEETSSYDFFNGGLALGYDCRILDRLSAGAEFTATFWNLPSKNDLSGTSGLSLGGRLLAYYNILPELSAAAFFGYKNFFNSKDTFLNDFEIGLSLRYNFTRGLFSRSNILLADYALDNIFPVFYNWYEENSFGLLLFQNNEKNAITDVKVSVFIEQYMANPNVCMEVERVERGESFEVPLTAFLNENILLNLEAVQADAKITISYKSLGRNVTSTHILEVQTLSRNNMTWEDDRRAAAFISPKDGSARFFANHIKTAVKDILKSGVSENIQYAQAVFAALKAYGINYVIDPSSAFTANVGTASVDILNFPYQTLLYHGGDCDDLTILNCSLMEALGIDTAIITVPGHIFMAIDSGISAEKASPDLYVIQDGKAWMPIEITLTQDTWKEARSFGMFEWKKYGEESRLYPLKEAWEVYGPVGIPDSNITLDIPTKKEIADGFRSTF
ncbi:MAG: hypothetical protein K5873_10325 [Treponema sp.]|nr:hypothetical protein [Treponema sp.]